MILLKVILSLVLAIIPFAYANYQRGQQKKGAQQSNLYTFLAKHLPKITKAWQAVRKFASRIYNGMKRSDSFRRFFTIITLLVLIGYQYVDFHVASSIAHTVRDTLENSAEKNVEKIAEIKVWLPYFTKPHATMLVGCFTLLFFSYRFSNKILTLLHNSRRLYCLVGLVTITLTILAPRWNIMAETLAIILMAAYVYPNKRPIEQPKGRKGIPVHQRQKTQILYREAA